MASEPPDSVGDFDLPFYNGYAVDVAALLAVYALVTYFITLWTTWVCCVKIPSWRSYRKWLVVGLVVVELVHVVCAFVTLDRYRSRETTFGNRTLPDWSLRWTFFSTALSVFLTQGVIAYVANAVCHPFKVVWCLIVSMIGLPFAWGFYAIFLQGGHADLASYAAYISQTAVVAMISDAAVIMMLSHYVLRPHRKALYSEAFVHTAEFLQPMLCLFMLLRTMPWFLSTMFKLPSYSFAASALKLGGLEVIGNLYPVILIVAVNAYEDENPTEVEEYWSDFRLTILVPTPPDSESAV